MVIERTPAQTLGWVGPCSNVFPTRTLEDLVAHLRGPLPALRDRLKMPAHEPLGVGLWIPASAAAALAADTAAAQSLAAEMRRARVVPFTLNGFPYGDFHADTVGAKVFLPAWNEPARRRYTLDLAVLLASWLPEGGEACISTVPLGLRSMHGGDAFLRDSADQLLQTAKALIQLEEITGRTIRLAVEPEPRAVVETMAEYAAFAASWIPEEFRSWLGVCWDLCHQNVVGESVEEGMRALNDASIPVHKIQISAAMEAKAGEGAALERFVEPRYLHQVGIESEGALQMHEDLAPLLQRRAPDAGEIWRVHFHVPLHRSEVSGLRTTQHRIADDLCALADAGAPPIYEVETYSWGVLPDEAPADESELVEGLARELDWVRTTLQELGSNGSGPQTAPQDAGSTAPSEP